MVTDVARNKSTTNSITVRTSSQTPTYRTKRHAVTAKSSVYPAIPNKSDHVCEASTCEPNETQSPRQTRSALST